MVKKDFKRTIKFQQFTEAPLTEKKEVKAIKTAFKKLLENFRSLSEIFSHLLSLSQTDISLPVFQCSKM